MFVITRDVTAAKKVIATLLATAMLLAAFGFNSFAEAANLTDVSDTLSDSSPGAESAHTLSFVTPNGVENAGTITVTFPAGFTGVGSITDGDVTIADDTVDETADWSVTALGQVITLTLDTGTVASSSVMDIVIGGTGAVNVISNPASPTAGNESFEIAISAGTADSGFARVVILDTVLVTAQVNTTFNFTVLGKASATINGEATNIATGSTTIPFGTLTADTEYTAAQELNVSTNAANGFVVTIETDGEFRSSTGAEIDGFVNNSDTAALATWSQPGATPGSPDVLTPTEWGHWGITTDDSDAGDGLFDGGEVGANEWFAATSSPRTVFAHTGPSDGTTADVGSTTVGFRVEISPLQEAGDDYQTTLTYIATPTF